MTTLRCIQARSTPDQIAAGIKWERVKLQTGAQDEEEVDQAKIHTFVMLVWDDAGWAVEEVDDNDATFVEVLSQGQSLSVEDARRDATLALLGACEAAYFFLYHHPKSQSPEGIRALIATCDATAQIIRSSAINLTSEDPA